jgi:hypothetical protein
MSKSLFIALYNLLYSITWALHRKLQNSYERHFQKKPSDQMNFYIGAFAATAGIFLMTPFDTVKTRLVVQRNTPDAYQGIMDCFSRILKEEGIGALYRSFIPRVISAVPMTALQVICS